MKYYLLTGLILALFLATACNVSVDTGDEKVKIGDGQVLVETEDERVEVSTDGILVDDGDSTVSVSGTNTVEIDMIAKKWDFVPNTVTVNKGDTVILHIASVDVNHGIALPDFDVNERLVAGSTTDIEFVADKEGSYTFFCNVFCGSGHGSMKGTLLVK